jgi:hypothetical protein
VTRDRCYDFKKILSPKNLAKNRRFLLNAKAKLSKTFDNNIGIEEKRQFFR